MARLLFLLITLGLLTPGVAAAATDTASPPAPPASAAEAIESDSFTVAAVSVDVAAPTATRAREVGFIEAQRKAWKLLWGRLSDKAGAVPSVGDSTLSTLVAGIDVESERFTSRRYIARLSVVFDPIAVRRYMGKFDGVSSRNRSQALLLLPVMRDGGAAYTYEASSPWARAWGNFGGQQSAIDYVQPTGTRGDAMFLNAQRGTRQNVDLLRLALIRYGAEDVLVADARIDRRYPGGPVVGTFSIFHGLDDKPLTRFSLRVADASGVATMLRDAVVRLDQALNLALRAGQLKPSKDMALVEVVTSQDVAPTIGVQSFGGLQVMVETPDAGAWSTLERKLRQAASVTGVTLTGLSLGGTSQVQVAHGRSLDWLRFDLDQVGLRLVSLADGGWLIRPKRPGDAPEPRPQATEEIATDRPAGTPAPSPGGAPSPTAAPVPQEP